MFDNLSTPAPMNELVAAPERPWKGNAATRCVGHKKSGERCRRQARRGTSVCDWHGAKAPQVKRRARQRIEEAADRMAKALLGIATSAESESVKLKAITEALDRAGLSTKQAVEIDAQLTIKPWEQILSGVAPLTRDESRARRGLPSGAQTPASASDDLDALAAIDLVRMSQDANVIDAEVVSESPTRRRYFDAAKRSEPLQDNGMPAGYVDRDTAQEYVHKMRLAAGCYPEQRGRR